MNNSPRSNIGIIAMEIYFPKTYVDQQELEIHDKVSKGKYIVGLGQHKLAFANRYEDVNSMALTVVDRLLKNNKISPSQIGKLEVGTETLVDKSKSTKTVLMTLFGGNRDIQGATNINACYGATNAFFNALNWVASDYWDGRLAIVVAVDIAVYEKGPARPTGGAGAVAMLIGPNALITVDPLRSTFMDHQYDFYKPHMSSQYPTVDGSLSIGCYLNALQNCYNTLKSKYNAHKCQFKASEFDFYCFHSPFHKMVQKAFSKLMQIDLGKANFIEKAIKQKFNAQVGPSLHISKNLGNIYTGSLYTGLISLIQQQNMAGKRVLMFSYGSGLMSSMFSVTFRADTAALKKSLNLEQRLQRRVKVSPIDYEAIMQAKQDEYGKVLGKIEVGIIEEGAYYLTEVDEKMRRKYQVKSSTPNNLDKMTPNNISSTTVIELPSSAVMALNRIQKLNYQISSEQMPSKIDDDYSGFYKLPVVERIHRLQQNLQKELDLGLLKTGGLTCEKANSMIENVIGQLALPLAVAPNFVINNKKYVIPMSTEEPSVVAACSSIAKLISPYSFLTCSTQNLMIGQVHLPKCEAADAHAINNQKAQLIQYLNSTIESLVKRGGGVENLRLRSLGNKHFSLDIFVNVCEAMGANIVNTLCERLKSQVSSRFGIQTGIAILSNYCTERMAASSFQIPVKDLAWKGYQGQEVAKKILEAYEFARLDVYRAATHNKGIMNGVDSVCLATGQDWRAVESAAHVHASATGSYKPLTRYELVERNGETYFKGSMEIPVAVGTVGGAFEKNPIYRQNMALMGNPDTKEFSEILATVGLAQNFAALRALAMEGIQKGHMALHGRSVAMKAGVPSELMERVCRFMQEQNKFDEKTARQFMSQLRPNL